MAQLFSDGAPPKAPVEVHKTAGTKPAAQRMYLVEVYNGAKKSEAKFAAEEDKQ
jgi:hypothetical protein